MRGVKRPPNLLDVEFLRLSAQLLGSCSRAHKDSDLGQILGENRY